MIISISRRSSVHVADASRVEVDDLHHAIALILAGMAAVTPRAVAGALDGDMKPGDIAYAACVTT
jgi:hypothetical protein